LQLYNHSPKHHQRQTSKPYHKQQLPNMSSLLNKAKDLAGKSGGSGGGSGGGQQSSVEKGVSGQAHTRTSSLISLLPLSPIDNNCTHYDH
jgi:hypothetical protein